MFLAALLWGALTLAGEVAVFSWSPYPLAAAEEARIVDEAFTLLMIMAVPVFAFTLAVLAYGVLRFRRVGEPAEDGPPIRSHGLVVGAWLVITTVLTLAVAIHPGITGMLKLRHHFNAEPDLVVQLQASRWAWRTTYPAYGVSTYSEMVLPVGQRVRFEITSLDVLHAFWIPAFRMKVDAVPGMVTTIGATPDRVGSMEEDVVFRVQCGELCGLGHTVMAVPVRVVRAEDFQAWLAQRATASR